MSSQQILQQTINAISLGAVYGLFALGYALIFSVLGVLNLAHSAVFMWGAYFGLYAVIQFQLPLLIAFPVAMLGAGLLGIVLDFVAFRPLRQRNAPRISQLISSIGASTLLVSLAQLVFGTQPQRFPPDIIDNVPLGGLPFKVTPVQVIVLLAAVILVTLLSLLITRTRLGQAMRTVAFNQRTASLLGINVSQIFSNTFFLAGVLAGVAGVLYGLAYSSITPQMGEDIALKGLTVIVLGGLGNITGAVIGGFVVAFIQTFSIAVTSSSYRDAIVFLLLFVILLVRPQGLIGQKEQSRA